MNTLRFALGVTACLAGTPSWVGGQSVVESTSTRVEIVGLKLWTVRMIQDSLARYAPGDSLTSHACAVILREKLHFADAAARYIDRPSGAASNVKDLIVVTVIEPHDSALVRYRRAYRDSQPDRREWRAAITVVRKNPHSFQRAIQDSAFLLHSARPTPTGAWRADVEPLRSLLLRWRSPEQRRTAAMTLANDGNSVNRVIAIVILANARESDTTWWSLADALRDPTGMVDATAQQVLSALTRFAPRRVDWAPALESVEAVLAGTNLFGHDTMMRALVATQVSPNLAKPLLRQSAPLILAKLAASEEAGREPAHRLLIQLRGRDLGTDPAPWAAWIRAGQ
jgi:hypothetical protein